MWSILVERVAIRMAPSFLHYRPDINGPMTGEMLNYHIQKFKDGSSQEKPIRYTDTVPKFGWTDKSRIPTFWCEVLAQEKTA